MTILIMIQDVAVRWTSAGHHQKPGGTQGVLPWRTWDKSGITLVGIRVADSTRCLKYWVHESTGHG